MAEIRLPRWIIANRNMPGGLRTSPKPFLVVPHKEHKENGVRGKWMGYLAGKIACYKPYELKEVFEGWEYRFWAAQQFSTGVYTECRVCGFESGKTPLERRHHHEVGGCAKKLTEASKLLLKDMMCVICDMKSHKCKWGIPICSDTCMQAWCESEAQPKALTAALLLVPKGD